MDNKYGRLFTEQDVVELMRAASNTLVDSDVAAKRIVDQFVGKLPVDEPSFLLRAKDAFALEAVVAYQDRIVHNNSIFEVPTVDFLRSVGQSIREFTIWREDPNNHVKIPD